MFQTSHIPEVIEVHPRRFGDDRGYLFESWNRERYREGGIDVDFQQDNVSFSAQQGTVRGLHFQLAPMAQAKLVTCLAGRILDVAVDVRPDSESFGRHVALELTAEAGNQMFIPAGFAHGFCTLEPNCMIAYKVGAGYAPQLERSLAFDDPALAIDWPVTRATAVLSERDRTAALLADLEADLREIGAA